MSSTELPIVDFSALSLDKVESDEISQLRGNGSLEPLAKELVNCLQEFGFCYLKHPGLSENKIDNFFGLVREVFLLPDDKKKAYARRSDKKGLLHGYANRMIERPQDTTSAEMYETFLTCPDQAFCWPDEVTNFKTAALGLQSDFDELSFRVLDLLGIGLELEFKTQRDDWLEAVVIPDTVLVLIGKMFQRWTSDKIKAPLHRVVIPVDEEARRKDRCSTTFFPGTPGDFVFEPLDGTNKYPPLTRENSLRAYLAGENVPSASAVEQLFHSYDGVSDGGRNHSQKHLQQTRTPPDKGRTQASPPVSTPDFSKKGCGEEKTTLL